MPTSKEEKLQGWVSVTEVVGYFTEPELVDWKVDTGRKESGRISRLTAKTGSRVHQLIEQEFREGAYKLKVADNSEVRSCMEAWGRFKKDYAPVIKRMEYLVTNEARRVMGHVDMEVAIGVNNVMLDVKTAGAIRPKHWVQLDGYAWLQPGFQGRLAVLRLDRNIGVYEYEEAEIDEPIFVQALNLYDFYTQRELIAQGG